MKNTLIRKDLVLGIALLCIGASIVSAFNQNPIPTPQPIHRGWFYVGGNGTGNYTNIQDAIDNASTGDTVFVYSNTYYEHISIGIQLYLIGEDKNSTIIDGNGTGDIINVSANEVKISGFTLQNSTEFSSSPSYPAAFRLSSDENVISDIIFRNCNKSMLLDGSSNNTFCYNNIELPPTGLIGESPRFQNGSNNNWFYNNTIIGHTMRLYDCNKNLFENNIWQNSSGIILNPSGTNNTIQFNYFYDNSGVAVEQNSDYNKIYGNTFVDGWFRIGINQTSHDNVVWHNNFINCTANVIFTGNYLYNSTQGEGNYWDNYTGNDTDGDGIGDTPYIVPGNASAQDLYPLMYPWYPSHPVVVYVDDDYDTSTPGWGYDRFNRIQYALNEAQENGTVSVFNGIYYENVVLDKNNLTFNGEDEDTTIIDANGAGDGILISVPSYNMNISHFTVRNANGSGIIFYDPIEGTSALHNRISYCIVYNSTIGGNDTDVIEGFGIYLGGHDAYLEDNTISNCKMYNNERSGIIITRSTYDQMNDTRIIDCNSYNNGFQSLNESWTKAGIAITPHNGSFIENTTISGCKVSNNSGDGIFSGNYSSGTIITENTVDNNGWNGINISGTTHSDLIYHNNLIENSQNNAYDGSANTWYNTTIQEGNYWSDYNGSDMNGDGIGDTPYTISGGSNQDLYPFMYPNGWMPVSYVWVDDDYNTSTAGWGYDHFSSIQIAIDAVDIGGTVFVYNGFYLEPFSNVDSSYVYIDKSISLIGEDRETTIIDCPDPSTNDSYGVRIGFSGIIDISNVSISGFTISGVNHTQSAGIDIQADCSDITIDNCIVHSFCDGISVDSSCSDITIRDCIVYDNNRSGGICFLETDYSDIIISDCIVHHNANGINVQNTADCFIDTITAYENSPGIGIVLTASINGTISNSVSYNNNDDGIRIHSCSDYNVLDCTVYNNGNDGIDLSGPSCTQTIVRGNNCSNNSNGIMFYLTDNNTVYENTLFSNNGYGIYSWGSEDNRIYHNNHISNNHSAFDDTANTWYNATIQEGNYWSDYTGEDSNHDGIGDTPYNISGGSNQDLYPLMFPLETYFILEIILENETILEGDIFLVTVKSIPGVPATDAIVEFNDELKTTDANGTVSFSAPQVNEDTFYTITAVKPGYTNASASIMIYDNHSEYKNALIFGRIYNLTTEGNNITFQAKNIRILKFNPISLKHYTQGQKVIISQKYIGFIGYRFLFALCQMPYLK
jgi:nitrous oxidase accessory protein